MTDEEALATPFLKSLVQQIRAHDSYGTWDRKTDADLLGQYIVTKEQRKEIPIIGDPDPDVLWRVEQFYAAIGLAIEKVTGQMASPMMKMSHEGFGRVIVTAGRLVVISKSLRDVHRFGYENLGKLAEDGAKLITAATEMMTKYPEVAAA